MGGAASSLMFSFLSPFSHIFQTDCTSGRGNWSQTTETMELEAEVAKYTLFIRVSRLKFAKF